MVNLGVCYVVLSTFCIGTLGRQVRLLRKKWVFSQLKKFFFLIIHFLLLIQRQRVRIVDGIGVVEFRVFIDSGLLVETFKGSPDTSDFLIKEYLSISSISDNNLIQAFTPRNTCYRTFAHVNGFDFFECC